MPERSALNEAMLFAKARLRVQDQDLKQGQVEMMTMRSSAGSILVPWGLQGGFAVVYKFRRKSGRLCALRCFLVQMTPDIKERYERLGDYFERHIRSITAGFKYHNGGINVATNVRGQNSNVAYPLIEMDWIEGVTLIEHVDMLCRARKQAALGDLVDQWVSVLSMLRRANIAHGDLAGSNILVRQDGQLILVDYDGVYIPEFAGKQGQTAGQKDYQHREMDHRPFDEHQDHFSALVIYTALLALHVQPALWDRYTKRSTLGSVQDSGLLFRHADFCDPDHSQLFAELLANNDQRLLAATQELKRACLLPIDQVRFPMHLLDPDFEEKQAMLKLEEALQRGDQQETLTIWLTSKLDAYAPAYKYRKQVDQAARMMQLVQSFRTALQSKALEQIVAAYDHALDSSPLLTDEERTVFQAARDFLSAQSNDDDEALAASYAALRLNHFPRHIIFTRQEAQRGELAQERQKALTRFRKSLVRAGVQAIAHAYDSILNGYSYVSEEERDLVQHAQAFLTAITSDDDDAILAVDTALKNRPASALQLSYSQKERDRIEEASKRKAAAAAVRQALYSKQIQQIAAAFDPQKIDVSRLMTAEELETLRSVRAFFTAFQQNDDQAIIMHADLILSNFQPQLVFIPHEEQRIELARRRMAALDAFRIALISKQVEQIIAAYDILLMGCSNVSVAEREQLSLAHDIAQAYQQNNDQAILDAWESVHSSAYRDAFMASQEQEERLELAQKRVNALSQLRSILANGNKNAEEIVAAYDVMLDQSSLLSTEEHEQVQAAQRFLHMRTQAQAAIQANDDVLLARVYDEDLAQLFSGLSRDMTERIKQARKYQDLHVAIQHRAYSQAIRISQEIEVQTRRPVQSYDLMLAKQLFIRQYEVQHLQAWQRGEEVLVSWYWPDEDLIRFALLLWRTDNRRPASPRGNEAGTYQEWHFRSRDEQLHQTAIRIEHGKPIRLQVHLAMAIDERVPPTWCYSNGVEVPGSLQA